MSRNSSVPTPENSRVVGTGKPVSTGTRNVAPNIATTCCTPTAIVAGQLRRSPGPTTLPGATVLPSPCTVQSFMAFLSPGRRVCGTGWWLSRVCPRRRAPAPLRRHAQMLAGVAARLSRRLGAGRVGGRGFAPFAFARGAELVEEADDDLAFLGREGGGDAEAARVLAADGRLGGCPRLRGDDDGERPAVGGMRGAADVPRRFEAVEELGRGGARDAGGGRAEERRVGRGRLSA